MFQKKGICHVRLFLAPHELSLLSTSIDNTINYLSIYIDNKGSDNVFITCWKGLVTTS